MKTFTKYVASADQFHAECLAYQERSAHPFWRRKLENTDIICVTDDTELRTGENVSLLEWPEYFHCMSDETFLRWEEFKLAQAKAFPPVIWDGEWHEELGEPFRNRLRGRQAILANPQPLCPYEHVKSSQSGRWGQWICGKGVVNEFINQPEHTTGVLLHNCMLYWLVMG